MVRGDLIVAILLFAFGTAISLSSYFVGLGKLYYPDGGSFPFGVGILLMACSAALIGQSIKRLKTSHGADTTVWSNVNFTKVGMILGAILLYILLLEPLGFLACAFLVQLLLFKVAGGQPWPLAIFETLVTLTVVYFVFFWGLGVYVTLFPNWIY